MILNNEILSLEKMSIFVPAPRETQHSTKCITIPALDEMIVHLKLTPSLPPPLAVFYQACLTRRLELI